MISTVGPRGPGGGGEGQTDGGPGCCHEFEVGLEYRVRLCLKNWERMREGDVGGDRRGEKGTLRTGVTGTRHHVWLFTWMLGNLNSGPPACN